MAPPAFTIDRRNLSLVGSFNLPKRLNSRDAVTVSKRKARGADVRADTDILLSGGETLLPRFDPEIFPLGRGG